MINSGRITLTVTQPDTWHGMGNTNACNNPYVQCAWHDFTRGNARKVESNILTEALTENIGFVSLLLLCVGQHKCQFYVLYSFFYLCISVHIKGDALVEFNQSKFLVMIIDKLSWKDHISFVCKKSLVVSEL